MAYKTAEQRARHAAAQRRYYERQKAARQSKSQQLSVDDLIGPDKPVPAPKAPVPSRSPRAPLTPEEKRSRHAAAQRRYYQRQKEKRQQEQPKERPTPAAPKQPGPRKRKPLTPEQKRKHAAAQRRYYQRQQEKKRKYNALSNKEKGLIKGAKSLGIDGITPDNVGDFADYVSYRYAQAKDSMFYEFDRWAEEYADLANSDLSGNDIFGDFMKFLDDRQDLANIADNPGGLSADSFNHYWGEYLDYIRE